MSAYKEAIKASIVAGNTELTASLLKLAPAFNSVIGALEAVVKRTDQTIADLLNEIEDMGLDDPQKYEKYAARAETTSASLDTYMAMSNEDLLEAIKSGVINPQMLEAMSQGVTDNVKTAIGFIPADERAGYVGEWSTFLAEFGENVGSFHRKS